MIHAVQVALESIYVSGPEPAERSEPCVYFLKRLWLQTVQTALCVHLRFDEAGVAQHSKVL
jgi:hypothetical protein